MKVLFVYLPFCSPVSPPYSLCYLAGFIKQNTQDINVSILDLNAWAHKQRFPQLYENLEQVFEYKNIDQYSQLAKQAKYDFAQFAKEENVKLRADQKSQLLKDCVQLIEDESPDLVSLSLVYNSQAFLAQSLVRVLKEKGIRVIVGGPAVTKQVKMIAQYLPHEVALLEEITQSRVDMDVLKTRRILDYSLVDKAQYFIPELVIPLKSSSCCYYQQCAFCTHHMNGNYVEYDLDDLKESVLASNARQVFLIDDMIHKKRLLDIAQLFKDLKLSWMCQLRPTKDLDKKTLQTLYDSGLRQVVWGVESGNDRILEKMKKGTCVKDIEQVLRDSKEVGITNVLYIMFGFPTETKEEFLDTIHFLEHNERVIDLISTSVFGLQEDAPVFKEPESFAITHIVTKQREKLPDKISYEVSEGLHADQAKILRKNYSKTLSKMNKFPKEMNIYREHLLLFISKTI